MPNLCRFQCHHHDHQHYIYLGDNVVGCEQVSVLVPVVIITIIITIIVIMMTIINIAFILVIT